MKIVGIIAEYNPFHLGHLHQINTIKKELKPDIIAVFMGGHFLQRGIPAIMDKWTRAKIAINLGVDIVFELPQVYSISSSDIFSGSGVYLAEAISSNYLAFGTSDTSIEILKEISRIQSNDENYSDILKQNLEIGYSFAKSSQIALSKILNRDIYLEPNDILALSYIKAIDKNNYKIKPYTIDRIGSAYHDECLSNISSATAIRKSLERQIISWKKLKETLPDYSYQTIRGYSKFIFQDDYSILINQAIISKTREDISKIKAVKEGLENKIKDLSLYNLKFSEYSSKLTSRRYAKSTINRILFSILLGIESKFENEDFSDINYLRVLAYKKEKAKFLKSKYIKLPLINNLNRDIKKNNLKIDVLKYDIRATAIYSQLCEYINANEDYRKAAFMYEGKSKEEKWKF